MNSSAIDLNDKSNILMIHHWDCDGLCSAAMLFNYLKEISSSLKIEYFLPEIGHYFLLSEDFLVIKEMSPDSVFIVDMALQKKDLLCLNDIVGNLYIFDHHIQGKIEEVNHINPFTGGNVSSLDYPSTGWVINDFFKKEQNLLSVLGAIGDQEGKVKNIPVIRKVLDENGLSFEDCVSIVKNIDSCYIVNNIEEIYRVVEILKTGPEGIKSILHDSQIIKNKEIINEKIGEIIKDGFLKDDKEKIIFKRIKSKFRIISDIARKISQEYPDYLVIIVNEDSSYMANIYFRTGDLNADLTPILSYAADRDYNAGGKNEVVGIFCPDEKVEEVIRDSLNIIKY